MSFLLFSVLLQGMKSSSYTLYSVSTPSRDRHGVEGVYG